MILVTGATGQVGGQVVDTLVAAGADVVASTRSISPPDGGSAPWHQADIAAPEGFGPILADVEAAFVFPVPGRTGDFIEKLAAAGVRQVVLLSSALIEFGAPNFIAGMHREIEEQVEQSGMDWTFVRPSGFMSNDLAWSAAIAAGEVVQLPYPEAATAPIHPADIGDVIAHALLEGSAGEVITISGPETLTEIERLGIIGREVGRQPTWKQIDELLGRDLLATQMPAPAAEVMVNVLRATTLDPQLPSTTTEAVIGQPARRYLQWARENAAAFAVS